MKDVKLQARDLAIKMVGDPVYLQELKDRLNNGTLAPPIEAMLWHYAYGKPTETFEGLFRKETGISSLSDDDLKSEAEKLVKEMLS